MLTKNVLRQEKACVISENENLRAFASVHKDQICARPAKEAARQDVEKEK